MKYRASPWYNKAMLNDKPLFQYYQHIAQDLLSNLFFHQLLKFPKEHFPVPQTNKARLVMMKTHHQKIRAKLYLFMLMLMASQLIHGGSSQWARKGELSGTFTGRKVTAVRTGVPPGGYFPSEIRDLFAVSRRGRWRALLSVFRECEAVELYFV